MGQLCSKLCKTTEDARDTYSEGKKSKRLPSIKQNGADNADLKKYEMSNDATKIMGIDSVSSLQQLTTQPKAEITFKDFERLSNLGSGAYGDVILVKKKTTGKQFAMKIIKKAKIVGRNLNPQMIIEKNVLLENEHPFLVRLKYAFQSEKKLYLVMEYCPGGELYTYLAKSKKFSIEISRFIAAEVLLGMEYLHKKMKIIYRDLKPENILVSEDGHLKIADFGLAKQFKNEDELTKTLRGTPEYIAPEVINANKGPDHPGYGLQCDIWAFGIFLFELIHGTPPFTDRNRNWIGIMNKILENKPVFNSDFSDESQDLIRQCLRNEPKERPNWEDIKAHSFFSKINWEILLAKGLESPLKKLIPRRNGAQLQRPRPIYETQTNDVFEQLNGFNYDPRSHSRNDEKF